MDAEDRAGFFRKVWKALKADRPGPTTCRGCGSQRFVCRENVPQEWPMKRNAGGISIVFETSGGSKLDYDSCFGAAVYCADCGKEEPDVGIDFDEE